MRTETIVRNVYPHDGKCEEVGAIPQPNGPLEDVQLKCVAAQREKHASNKRPRPRQWQQS